MTTIPPPAPRRSNGCLWGCLAVIFIIALPFVAASAYTAWFFYEGWRHNPVLRAAAELVNHDGMAHLALGENIHITAIDGSAFSAVMGLGAHTDYRVDLEGSKGAGTLDIAADSLTGQVRFQSMVLTGPDGRRYDLMNHSVIQPMPERRPETGNDI